MEISQIGKREVNLQEIIDFFEQEEGYDKDEIICEILHEIKGLKGYDADEIDLKWDKEELMVLYDFVDEFYSKLINKVCNVIKSFQ